MENSEPPAAKTLTYGLLTFLILLPAMILIYSWYAWAT
jgi:hypothetical protein